MCFLQQYTNIFRFSFLKSRRKKCIFVAKSRRKKCKYYNKYLTISNV